MQVLIVDLGSQYTTLIGRSLRELGVRSLILPPDKAEFWLAAKRPKGIILSGSPDSIYDPDALLPPKAVLNQQRPILGICYGMHWLAQELGGEVGSSRERRGYGEDILAQVEVHDALFHNIPPTQHTAWMSHGDSVTKLPPGFYRLAQTDNCPIAAMSSDDGKIFGVQFHPEVKETEHGADILRNFLRICGATPDWVPENTIKRIRDEIQESVPPPEQCIIAFSGGVDSTTLTAIAAPVLGRRLHCVAIDAGNLRESELEEIRANAESAGAPSFEINHVAPAFIRSIGATTDAELKREVFQFKYGAVLENNAKLRGAKFLLQGTLAPDRIESAATGESARIKTHHNVGLNLSLTQLHPLGEMFKYEVRDLARSLDLPPSVTERKPFPGPGLFCRIVGVPVTEERLELVRWADAQTRRIVTEAGIQQEISQLIVALIGVRTVGIKGDGRSYGYAIAVRAVQTSDFMTCRGYQFPPEVRRKIQHALTKYREVTRVWFDENDKPPATVEFE